MKHLLKNPIIVEIIGKMPTIKQLFFSVLGVLLLGFLFLALLSYNINDPAWSHVGGYEQTTNIMGRLGAWVSDILRSFFGLGAWWLIMALCLELAYLWWKDQHALWQLRLVVHTMLLVLLSGFLALLGTNAGTEQALYFGGVVGYKLHTGLIDWFGTGATAIFLLALILIGLSLVLNFPHKKLLGKKTQVAPAPPTSLASEDSPFSVIKPNHSAPKPTAPKTSLNDFLQQSGIKDSVASHLAQAKEKENTPQQTPTADTTAKKVYADNHGMRVTAVHTDVKIHHDNQEGSEQRLADSPKAQQITPDKTQDFKHVADEPITEQSLHSNTQNFSQSAHHETPSQHEPQSLASDHMPAPETTTHPKTNKPQSRAMGVLEHRLSLSPIPELSLLDPAPPKQATYTQEELGRLSELLEIKLQEFNIDAQVMNATVGPVITRFELALAPGVKSSRVSKISQDLARSMSMPSLRVIPVIAGKSYIGIEVPNHHRKIVGLIELLNTDDYQDPNAGISIAIGQDISGRAVIADLAKAPHMLVAGTTGSGKSVLVNSFLLSMLLKYTPDELRLVLIDPKQLELANYADIPHLLTPVVTDMTEAVAVLNWCVTEMERRYKLIGALKVRQLSEFNKKVRLAEEMGEPLLDPLWQASEHVSEKAPKLKPLSKIVVVADEFADMIMQLGKTAEEPIVRLAQKARAAGIHLILATQRPVASVVTGLIKSNVPSRVALRVNSAMDSRLIIEENGAENMLGHGDMMFLAPGKNTTERVHGAYVKDDEVNRITDAWRERGSPDYIDFSSSYGFEGEGSGNSASSNADDEEYYNQAVAFFMETKKVSISSLQRKFSIGYNKSARLVDLMQERGVVSAPDSAGKRQLLI